MHFSTINFCVFLRKIKFLCEIDVQKIHTGMQIDRKITSWGNVFLVSSNRLRGMYVFEGKLSCNNVAIL